MATQIRTTWESPGFAAEVRSEADTSQVVVLTGEIDVATAGTLREVFLSPVVVGTHAVRVDLTGVTFLGSVGISVLVSECKRVRASGGTFSLICSQGLCRRVLEISGLIEYLQVEDVV